MHAAEGKGSTFAAGEHGQGLGTLCDDVVVSAGALGPAVYEDSLHQDFAGRGGVL
jgi:hypothetical protein